MFGGGIEIADSAMSFTMDHYWSHPETVTFLNDEIPQGGKYIPKKTENTLVRRTRSRVWHLTCQRESSPLMLVRN